MSSDILLQHFLVYLVVPIWLLAGLADYFCHRASHIERTSGVTESLLHLLQFAQVGVPLLAVLFLEINAAVLLVMLTGLVLHQATAMWDVRYANATRRVTPIEQHVHGVLEMTPAMATALVAILHWPQFLALLGAGEADFSLQFKRSPLPGWYLGAVMLGVVLCGVLPYGEELWRTVRSRQIRARAA
ncbi:MAG TPA: hypothetical protein VFF19_23345 [Reyranella sp.]|nr:hypothetical protein [Reyranella sp.]